MVSIEVGPAPRKRAAAALARPAAAEYRPRSALSRDGRQSWRAGRIRSPARQECGLTLRSRRGPTASPQARAGGTRTFSPARAWRLAVGPASTQTLGLLGPAVSSLNTARRGGSASKLSSSRWHLGAAGMIPSPNLERGNTATRGRPRRYPHCRELACANPTRPRTPVAQERHFAPDRLTRWAPGALHLYGQA